MFGYRMTRMSILLAGCSAMASAMAAPPPQAPAAGPATAQPGAWPKLPRPAAEAPSVLLIMTDDVGYGASSTFGGPVETPVFDALAKEGVRYNQFTTTGICSPTRAALLTGRNHHAVNIGTVTDGATAFDGYTSDIPKSAATGVRLLRDAGYATAMFGKGHITPSWEMGPTGPFDRWPTGLGFQYFYGFLGGDTNQWAPALYENTAPVEPPANDPDYILDRDLADKAITWIRTARGSAPNKPFFAYYAPGTAHAPHHAPADWIARYKGRFDEGWDVARERTLARQKAMGIVPRDTKLAPRPASIPAWNTLSAQQKRVYAHEMEVYAAALSFADHEIGRVIEEARRESGGNLMVVYIQGDNGASAEAGLNGTLNEHGVISGINESLQTIDDHLGDMGGPNAMNHYSIGWAYAMNAPFPWVKQIASHFGATRNGAVISWPGHMRDVEAVRPQFHHVTDIMPTILEAAKITPPETVDGVKQQPFDGISMRYTFTQPRAPSARHTQYYNIWDNMAVYHDGWVAASQPLYMPWDFGAANFTAPPKIEGRKWELYNIAKDFSETVDLAAKYPAKLEEMKGLFFAEAERNKALPIHRFEGRAGRPSYNDGITDFHYSGPVSRLLTEVAPPLAGRSFEMKAEVTVGKDRLDGTLMAIGGRFGGMALYVEGGRPAFTYNLDSRERTTIAAETPLSPGKHRIHVLFDRAQGFIAPAKATLVVDDVPAGTIDIPRSLGFRFTLDESFDIGSDTGTSVSDKYAAPNSFQGTIDSFDVKLK